MTPWQSKVEQKIKILFDYMLFASKRLTNFHLMTWKLHNHVYSTIAPTWGVKYFREDVKKRTTVGFHFTFRHVAGEKALKYILEKLEMQFYFISRFAISQETQFWNILEKM